MDPNETAQRLLYQGSHSMLVFLLRLLVEFQSLCLVVRATAQPLLLCISYVWLLHYSCTDISRSGIL